MGAKTFGQLIRERRVALGLSQKDLVAKIRKGTGEPISPQYHNDIEFDRRIPSEALIAQYAQQLGLSTDALLLAAGIAPADLQQVATERPEQAERLLKAFRKATPRTR